MLTRRQLSAAAVISLLGGCGFHPVYGPGAQGAASAAVTGLSQVNVALIPERSGQLLRDALQQRLERTGGGLSKLYDLSVAFAVSQEATAISRTDSIGTRTRMTAVATWSLVSMDSERRTVTSGVARSVDGFNPLDIQYFYSDLQTEQTTRRLADAVADQISLQLASWFSVHPGPG